MQKTFHLTEQDINAIVEDTRAYLVSKKIADKDILKLELFIEEALLRYRDKFGRGQEVVVETSNLPAAKVIIKLKAEYFNPIDEDEESILSSEYLRNLMEIIEGLRLPIGTATVTTRLSQWPTKSQGSGRLRAERSPLPLF